VTDAEHDDTPPVACQPCRGTGRVVSNLGGSPTEKECPWCEGTGHLLPEHDAQAHWREGPAASD
jgi:DnaJ-class molecular chaperone